MHGIEKVSLERLVAVSFGVMLGGLLMLGGSVWRTQPGAWATEAGIGVMLVCLGLLYRRNRDLLRAGPPAVGTRRAPPQLLHNAAAQHHT
ncbi:MAG: hypothetical protein H7Z39_09710, partial [Burkholderiaceae bacterium]|nr:hypothetical protein [Burkholderiaceae bacterium]